MQEIAEELSRFGPFKLTHTEIGYYYHLQDLTYKLDKNQLFIKLRIPLTATTTVFSRYRIHSVPIPLGADHSDRSIIELPKPYLAISYDRLFYMLLSESEYQFCTGNHLKRCNQSLTMQETTNPNYALALFYDQSKLISKLCPVTFLPKTNQKESHVITVSENSYLISSDDTQWIQTCTGGTPVHISPCRLCIIKLPCACSLKGQTFFMPPTLQNCKHISKPLVVHSLNLAALFHFYKDHKEIYNLTAKAFFPTPVLPDIPKIAIISKRFNDVVKQEEQTKMSLKQIALNLKNKDRIYSDRVSKLDNDLGLLTQPEISTGIPIITCLNFVFAIIALGMSFNVYCKLLVLVKSISGFNLLNSATSTPTTHVLNERSSDCLYLIVILLVFIVVVGIVVVVCVKYWFQYKTVKNVLYTKVCITLFGGRDSVSLVLTHTGCLAKDLKLEFSPDMVPPKVNLSILTCTVNLKWNNLKLKTNHDQDITFPDTIRLSPMDLFKVRKTIENLTEIQILTYTYENYCEIHRWVFPTEIQRQNFQSCRSHDIVHTANPASADA